MSASDSERYAAKLKKHSEKLERAIRKHTKAEAKRLRARFIAHVSVPDGTAVAPSECFIKTWRVRNDGTTGWPEGTRFVFLHKSDSLGGPAQLTLNQSVQVGQEIEVSLQLTAPEKEGLYEGHWRFHTPEGFKFGQRMSAAIHVLKGTPHASGEDSLACGSSGVASVSKCDSSDDMEMADFEKVPRG